MPDLQTALIELYSDTRTRPTPGMRRAMAEAEVGDEHEQPDVHVRGVIRRLGDDWLVSLFLVNGQQEPPEAKDVSWQFQTELEVHGLNDEPIFVKRALPVDATDKGSVAYAEERQLAMAYRDTIEFAVGHGVAVHAEPSSGDPTRAVRITTRAIPHYDVPMTDVPTAEDEGFEQLAGLDQS